MGSKRSVKPTKRKILDLESVKKENSLDENKAHLARMSWKLKYELINSDQLNNGTEDDKESSEDEEEANSEKRESSEERKEEVKVKTESKQKTTVLAGLSGYLSCSDSNDSSDEEVDIKTEVQAFLKEVNSIKLDNDGNPVESPERKTEQKCASEGAAMDQQQQAMRDYYAAHGYTMPTTAWQECYDSSSGYSYYWNMDTNEVVWEMPAEYQYYVATVKKQWEDYNRTLYATQQSVSSSQNVLPAVQVAKTDSEIGSVSPVSTAQSTATIPEKVAQSKTFNPQPSTKTTNVKGKRKISHRSDSEDEKIELITSYGPNSDDQSSEDEEDADNNKEKKRRNSGESKNKNSSIVNSRKRKLSTAAGADDDVDELKKQSDKKKATVKHQDVNNVTDKNETVKHKIKQDLDGTLVKKLVKAEQVTAPVVSSLPYKPELPTDDNVPSPGEAELVERLKNQAEVLKRLGGELPEGVSKIISDQPPKMEKKKGSPLVAGYGDEIDSDSEDKEKEIPQPTADSLKLTNKDDLKLDKQIVAAGERVSKRVLKLSAKTKQLINASELTKRARQTDFVKTPLGLRPADPSNLELLDGMPIIDDKTVNNTTRTGLGFSSETAEKTKPGKPILFVSGGSTSTATSDKEQSDSCTGDSETSLQECAELLQGKMKFLCEGKEAPSPVQIWAEQLEILHKAWESKSLKNEFLSSWMQNISERLTQLESNAVPSGWLCLWSREERRYYYKKKTTGEILWEFPVSECENIVEESDKTDGGVEASSAVVGEDETVMDLDEGQGEVEMELCLTPPHPSSPPSPPPPPVISTALSPPPPPVISFPSEGDGIGLLPDEPPPPPSTPPPLPEEAPPPLPEEAPPPPPLPLDEAPPLPPGEPLPPGVEPPTVPSQIQPPLPSPVQPPLPSHSQPPLPIVPPLPPAIPVPNPTHHRTLVPHPPAQDYNHMVLSSTSYHHLPYHQIHYGPQSQYSSAYVSAAPIPAPLPSKVEPEKPEDINSELSSFYNDLATLEPEEDDQNETASTGVEEQPLVGQDSPDPVHPTSSSPDPVVVKKKKKTKLAPGLALKKKGVSSLVAKWQKVQESARRDF